MIPTSESVLETLSRERLHDVSRTMGIQVRGEREAKKRVAAIAGARLARQLPAVLRELGREELRAACRAHGLPDEGRARRELQERLLVAAGLLPTSLSEPPPARTAEGLPQPGQVVEARHRQWLVEEVVPGEVGESPLVRMVCLDDDAPGRALEVLWDLELGARVLAPSVHGLGTGDGLDPPSHFGAYLHAVKWSAVSAADATRFQAPFRAGIKLMAHQLTPLMKALELPRANLFIADDVGLGKTIEAGLVLQELLLRHQADFVLVLCPPSVCLQWRDEMQRRFGLRFEVMTRQFVAHRRRDRGFGVNAWATHNRFILSHALLRRPEYRDSLLAHLGPRARKGLLILDEAHAAAPASASKYAVDSDLTHAVRDLAPRFDNRLFLSATPHNGHSNSFSALLEILDPVRFTRGVPVAGREALEPVMVRRLKRDLRQLGVERFPRRMLVEIALENDGSRWTARENRFDAETKQHEPGGTSELGEAPALELELAEKLARYTELCAPAKGRGRLVFVHLQKRLLSSPEAFARTLEVHARSVERQGGPVVASTQRQTGLDFEVDPESHGEDDEAIAAAEDAEVARASAELPSPTEEAKGLLKSMRVLAERARRTPDAKVRAMLAWIREHMCPAVGSTDAGTSRGWTDRRVILFTEYADTKRYLHDLLTQSIAHTDRAEERIRVFHGGMGDDTRDEVQRAFNAPPSEDPVRILIATDAAREGINLQAHCADLFHVDIPWNPSRLEQRNGRIDRTLQRAEEVRCHYFVYPARTEDIVLRTLVRKVETVQRELGSLGAVLLDDVERILEPGITSETEPRVAAIGASAARAEVEDELETSRKDLTALRAEVVRAGRRLEESKAALAVSPDALRGVVDIGLRMAGTAGLARATGDHATLDGEDVYVLPDLGRGWAQTLDTLRPPRRRDESFWEWRNRPPRPVTFAPIERMSAEVEQLHLAHPLVKRVLDRFLAQGYSAHDLRRATAVVTKDDGLIRVVAYARLSLFGAGAARLHDELLAVASAWSGEGAELTPLDAVETARSLAAVERALSTGAQPAPVSVQARVAEHATDLYASLWPALEAEADAHAVQARTGLAQRARRESTELVKLLERQKVAIDKASTKLRQGELFAAAETKSLAEQQRQLRLDLEHLKKRRLTLDEELVTEPEAIASLYDVRMTRLSPVGLVVSYPESMT